MKGDRANEASDAGRLELLELATAVATRLQTRSSVLHRREQHQLPWHQCNVQPCVRDLELVRRVHSWRP